ncbi:unnamed protein product [Parajaminaea phylloscopi]
MLAVYHRRRKTDVSLAGGRELMSTAREPVPSPATVIDDGVGEGVQRSGPFGRSPHATLSLPDGGGAAGGVASSGLNCV